MNYQIRPARKSDMPEVMRLIRELAEFEKELDEVEVTVEDLERDGFGTHPLFHCFVAENEAGIDGMALVYERYSTWKGRALHLEDLIVSEAARGQGIGDALLTEVVRFGHELGCKRIQWEVLDWNERAIQFYENKGAFVMRDWHVVQLREAGIAAYLKGN
jgi:GNAT superfamily N-acetyltransferase